MGRALISIPKAKLKYLYWNEYLSPFKIAKIYNCNQVTVRTRMREYGIPKRSGSEARMRYRKFDFSGDLIEKGYMLGFRLGDLNVYQTSKKSDLIVVRCNTTQVVQVKLIEEMFSRYGKVTISKGSISTNVQCFLNRSFDFLLPKNQKVPTWICKDVKTIAAFIAGYIDAEGNFILNQGRARFKIDSYDLGILRWIATTLNSRNISVKLRRIAKKGKFFTKIYKFNKDLWRININDAISLLNFISYIKPFIKHKARLQNLMVCEMNIKLRIYKGSVKYAAI